MCFGDVALVSLGSSALTSSWRTFLDQIKCFRVCLSPPFVMSDAFVVLCQMNMAFA